MAEDKDALEKGKEPSLEKAIERLEAIVTRLESGEVSLEKSIDLYEEGRRLGSDCLGRLAKLEKRVQLVMQAADGRLVTQPFENGGDE